MRAKSYAAHAEDKPLEYYEFDRREPNDTDVEVKIHYTGVCHSDIHTARGDWGEIDYPCVPGHEIIGEVLRVGKNVKKFKKGDLVGVGVFVNCCKECGACKAGLEQYCEKDPIWTYSAIDPIDGSVTQGGYSDLIVAQEDFVVHIPEELDEKEASPLLCAGITLYSPLKHWKAGPGVKVAILGLGGLGHMGVKYAHALGADVTVITSSPNKADDAKKYGADEVLISSSEKDMEGAKRKFDLIIDTIPVKHDLKPYMELLNVDGTIVLVGPINPMPEYHGNDVMNGRKSIAGSGIGSVKEVEEMLEFSAKHGILPDTELIKMEDINEAWDNMVKGKMSHRYVIDIQNSFK